jgi:hypothetical protein
VVRLTLMKVSFARCVIDAPNCCLTVKAYGLLPLWTTKKIVKYLI